MHVTPPLPMYAVLLAAGRATRFGSTKQLAQYKQSTLIRSAVVNAETVCAERTVTVLGHDRLAVWHAMSPIQGFMVINEQHDNGLSGSLAHGIRALPSTAAAVLILLADQPLVPASHLQQLAKLWQQSPDKIVASAYADTLGPPVIFPANYFNALQELSGDQGARKLIESNLNNVVRLSCEAAASDIDTAADLDLLR